MKKEIIDIIDLSVNTIKSHLHDNKTIMQVLANVSAINTQSLPYRDTGQKIISELPDRYDEDLNLAIGRLCRLVAGAYQIEDTEGHAIRLNDIDLLSEVVHSIDNHAKLIGDSEAAVAHGA